MDQDNDVCGSFPPNKLHYQPKPNFLQIVNESAKLENKNCEQEIIVETGFKTLDELNEWCDRTYGFKDTDAARWEVERNMLTHYSRRGYLCSNMTSIITRDEHKKMYNIIMQFKHEQHAPRKYHKKGKFAHTMIVYFKGFHRDESSKWEATAFRYDYA